MAAGQAVPEQASSEQAVPEQAGSEQVRHHMHDSGLHAPTSVSRRKRKLRQPHVSKLYTPLHDSNQAEVNFFWSLFEDMHPKTDRDFVNMAVQCNTLLTPNLNDPRFLECFNDVWQGTWEVSPRSHSTLGQA